MTHSFCLVAVDKDLMVYCTCGWIGPTYNRLTTKERLTEEWRDHYLERMQVIEEVKKR